MSTTGMLRPYGGRENKDFDEFWVKFRALSRRKGWTSEEKRIDNFPLYLEGNAFPVFSRLSEQDQAKEGEVKKKLVSAFTLHMSCSRKGLRLEESVDAYFADLQRLSSLARRKAAGDDDEYPIVIKQLISGLPSEFSLQLRMSLAGQTLRVSECQERVRALRSSERDSRDRHLGVAAAAVTALRKTTRLAETRRSSAFSGMLLCVFGKIARSGSTPKAGPGRRSVLCPNDFCD